MELNENFSNNIWMIRNDGEILDLSDRSVHPCLRPDWKGKVLIKASSFGLIEDLIWYYNNTRHKDQKKNIKELLSMLSYYEDIDYYLTKENLKIDKYETEPIGVDDLYQHIVADSKQEFIKLRRGGDFVTERNSDLKELTVRIASSYFNWFDYICMFLIQYEKYFNTLRVCRDLELTGSETVLKLNGELLDNYSVEKFIQQKGRPSVESFDNYSNKLSKGLSLSEAYGVNNHRHNINQYSVYEILYEEEL